MKAGNGKIRITLVKSPIGYSKEQKDTLKALGLRRLWQTVEKEKSPAILGMVNKVSHLVKVEEVS
ncbi:MAG: 50S ribosomal protein L30 [Anaerolineae bacterium]|nr:50S ribosomal protein L30 [Anaerolineae bacterium]MDW8101550.1 50S ribosomal protein L30 [Anaerolineae bacterium]